MIKNKFVLNLVLSVIVLSLIGACIFVYKQKYLSEKRDLQVDIDKSLELEKLSAGNQAINNQDYTKAIALFDSLAETTNNKFDSQHFLLLKAYSLFSTENQNDTQEALTLINSVIQSPDSTPNTRAWAYIALLNFYYISDHPENMLRDIRSLSAFSDIPDINTDDFLQHLLIESDDLVPTSFGKMYLALSLGRKLFTEQDTLTNEERVNIAKNISTYIETSTLLKEQEDRLSQIPHYQNMWLAHMQGFSLGLASAYGGYQTDYVGKLTTAIDLAKDQPDNVPMQQMALYSNFYLAAFSTYNVNRKSPEIAESAIANIVSKSADKNTAILFESFIKATLSSSKTTINKDLLQKLTDGNEGFKEYVDLIISPQS